MGKDVKDAHRPLSFPTSPSVIPANSSVIPAKAGIQRGGDCVF